MDWIPDKTHFDAYSETMARLSSKQERLQAGRPLPAIAVQKIKDSLAIEWTYNSNGIEGNSLTLNETHMVLNDGMTVKGKPLREHFEAFNHNKAIYLLYEMVAKNRHNTFKTTELMELHAVVLQNIEEAYAGRFRTGGVRIMGANFVPPNARKVPDLVDELMKFISKGSQQMDIVASATLLHHRLVWIHPFFDGNGRTARLIMNLFFLRQGYPPAIILKNDRKKYYTALNKANKGDYTKLYLLIAQALERSLNIYLSIIPDQEDYLPISQVVQEPEIAYGQEYVSLLARKGKIDAYKQGRNWVTTKSAVLAYVAGKSD